MAMKLTAYKVKASASGEVHIAMPRRAKVIAVTGGIGHILLHTQCLHDDDTRAFDVTNTRTFAVLEDGDTVPDGCMYIGSGRPGPRANPLHLFEMPKVRPIGL